MDIRGEHTSYNGRQEQTPSGRLSGIIHDYKTRNALSIRALSDKLDVSHGYLSKIERGVGTYGKPISPTIQIMSKLARGMNLSLRQLLQMCGYFDDEAPEDIDMPQRAYGLDEGSQGNLVFNDVESRIRGSLSENNELFPDSSEEMDIVLEMELLASHLKGDSICYVGFNELNENARACVADEIQELIQKIRDIYGGDSETI